MSKIRKDTDHIYDENGRQMANIILLTQKDTGYKYILSSVMNESAKLKSLSHTAMNYDRTCQNNPLHRDIRKYGIDSFEYKEIKRLPFTTGWKLDLMTQDYINMST
jgi:hypothetical protein